MTVSFIGEDDDDGGFSPTSAVRRRRSSPGTDGPVLGPPKSPRDRTISFEETKSIIEEDKDLSGANDSGYDAAYVRAASAFMVRLCVGWADRWVHMGIGMGMGMGRSHAQLQ